MHPPLVTWLADERITTDSLAPQFFRIINLDKDAGVSISVTSQVVLAEPSNFYDANNVEVSPCSAAGGDFAAGCASDGTGYKVEFMANPTRDGVATILIKAKEIGSGGKTGLTSFTIRREQNGDDNPPVIQALPNRVLQVDPGTHTAKYQTHFVIGDLTADGVNEDIDEIHANDAVTVTASNLSLFSTLAIELNPPDLDPEVAAKQGRAVTPSPRRLCLILQCRIWRSCG
jgi:hypothetical protein